MKNLPPERNQDAAHAQKRVTVPLSSCFKKYASCDPIRFSQANNWISVYGTGHLIGWEKKSEIVQYFPGRLCATIGLFYAINYAIFSGLIYIVLPGFKGEKPL